MVSYKTMKVDGLDIFYREAGFKDAPAIVLLHGFPASSHMFRNLIPALADQFYLVAPDYPGFGNSSMPSVDEFEYSFDNLAEVTDKFIQKLGLNKYSLYLMDYGAPVGFRIAVKHPEKVESLIIQNGNAYEEGLASEFWNPLKAYWKDRSPETEAPLRKFLTLDATKWQYTNGVRDPEAISPDGWNMDTYFLNRPGNDRIQLELFYSYGTNPPLYPRWQAYLREYRPQTLIVWGKNDAIFPPKVPIRISGTSRILNSTYSIPGTLPWKRMAMSSLIVFARSWQARYIRELRPQKQKQGNILNVLELQHSENSDEHCGCLSIILRRPGEEAKQC